jgi:hypothetical protein
MPAVFLVAGSSSGWSMMTYAEGRGDCDADAA